MNTFLHKNLRQLGKSFNRTKRQLNHAITRGFFKKPFFYFGFFSVALLLFLCTASPGLATLGAPNTDSTMLHSFLTNSDDGSPFVSQSSSTAMETPDLKIVADDAISAVSTPQILTTQTLGDVFGSAPATRNEVINYTVQPGDTIASLAQQFNISPQTIAWANNLSVGSALTSGQSLTILPVSGIVYIVKAGDTLGQIAATYKAKADDIIAFNALANESDIFIGDLLIIPDGVMPKKPVPIIQEAVLPNSFWIYPLLRFKETQGIHFENAVDIASLDGAGSPVYAAAAGVVQRAIGNGKWNSGMGNYVTILHTNSVITYYGHLSSVLVKPGDTVYQGQEIGTEGQTGDATGPHVHFEVIGAANFIAQRFSLGAIVDVTKQ